MASREELDELFAYLDQLALNERLEQEKDVVEGVELQGADGGGQGATGARKLCEEAVTESAGEEPCSLTTPISDELESTSFQSAEAPSTPPRRRVVQFDAVTPMKTPQRKAPKLVFTPLRPVQPVVPPPDRSSPEALEASKEAEDIPEEILEGVVLSPADSSFRRSFILDSPDAQTLTATERQDIAVADDVSQVSLIISALASPSPVTVVVNKIEQVQDDASEELEVPSPVRPAATPRRQTKKRVVYSSDEDSQDPDSRTLPPPTRTDEAADIEVIRESALPEGSPEDQIEPSTKTKATRSNNKKTTKDVSKFFDTMARATGRDSEDDDSDDAGSLNDFIVDDDYVEYEKEDSDDPDAYVLTYSPTTPKPRKKAGPAVSVTVDLTETSEEEDADPISSMVTGPRPKPRPRAPPIKPLPTATPKKSRTEKKSWNENKQKLAMDIMQELDELVFEDKLVKEWNVSPVWNNKLLTTAGRAHHKRIKMSDGTYKHEGRIELSEKVIDDEAKLKNTVAHEMCHLATWIISGEMKNPHGAVFKSWGKKVMRARRDIEVTTKHSYEITYKYEWECVTEGCDAVYRRHSKSIDIETQACGKCRGRLRPMFKTRGAGAGSTPFQDFLKQNMKLAKAAMPKATHGDVMRALSERWKAIGGAKTAAEIVQAGEDPLAAQRAHVEYWQVMSLQMQGLSIA